MKPKSQSLSRADPALTGEQMRGWIAQYRLAAVELQEQKRRELRALTDEEAFRQARSLMQSVGQNAWMNPRRRDWSGLVEQQKIFQRIRQETP